MREILPERAVVRPRVPSALSGERLLPEDMVEAYLRAGRPGAICLFGPPGAGKSAALGHLSAPIPRSSIVALLDDPEVSHVTGLCDRMLVLYSAPEPFAISHLATYRLLSWGEDQCLEDLEAAEWPRVATVLGRVCEAMSAGPVPDSPELWRICLDQMAADDSIVDFDQALKRLFNARGGILWRPIPGRPLCERRLGARGSPIYGPPSGNLPPGLFSERPCLRPAFRGQAIRLLHRRVSRPDRSPAEEIRVANLTGADLRGAPLAGTDFYLVDLRGARFTTEQEEYLRKCRAILETRA